MHKGIEMHVVLTLEWIRVNYTAKYGNAAECEHPIREHT